MNKHREERLADIMARAKARMGNDQAGFPTQAAPTPKVTKPAASQKKAVAETDDDFEF